MSALGDGDAAVRAAAARELGQLDYGSAIPVLTDALQGEGEVEEVRERSAVRWLSWPRVPSVSLRRPKQDELRHDLEGLVFSSTRRPAGITRCLLACANVLRHAVELSGEYSEVHVMTLCTKRPQYHYTRYTPSSAAGLSLILGMDRSTSAMIAS